MFKILKIYGSAKGIEGSVGVTRDTTLPNSASLSIIRDKYLEFLNYISVSAHHALPLTPGLRVHTYVHNPMQHCTTWSSARLWRQAGTQCRHVDLTLALVMFGPKTAQFLPVFFYNQNMQAEDMLAPKSLLAHLQIMCWSLFVCGSHLIRST